MNLFFKSDKLTLPQQVLKNKNDIETLKDKAFIVNPTGAFVENKIYKKYDMVAYQNNAYIYINDAESQNIDPTNTDYWALYSSAQTGLQGPKGATGLKGADGWGFNNATIINIQNETVNVDNNGIGLNQTMHVTAEQQVGSLPPQSAIFDIATQTVLPITGSDTVVVDLAEDGRHANIHLDADITNKLSKTITTPVSAPTSTEIVAVDNTNSQTMLSIGDGLSVENGILKASGGSSGDEKLYAHNIYANKGVGGNGDNHIILKIINKTSSVLTANELKSFLYVSGFTGSNVFYEANGHYRNGNDSFIISGLGSSDGTNLTAVGTKIVFTDTTNFNFFRIVHNISLGSFVDTVIEIGV